MSNGNKPRPRLDGRIESSIKDVLRIDLLHILNERPASPRELAATLEEDVGTVLGHIVELWADNCVEVVAEDQEADGDEADRRYRTAPPFRVDEREMGERSLAERERLFVTVLQAILTEALQARRTGSLFRHDGHLSYKLLKLDDRGWRELVALLLRTLKEAEAIEDGSRERLGVAGEEGVEAVVALMGYERSAGAG